MDVREIAVRNAMKHDRVDFTKCRKTSRFHQHWLEDRVRKIDNRDILSKVATTRYREDTE